MQVADRMRKRAADSKHGFGQALGLLSPRIGHPDPALASRKFGPVPTFLSNSHVRSRRIPTLALAGGFRDRIRQVRRRSDDLDQ